MARHSFQLRLLAFPIGVRVIALVTVALALLALVEHHWLASAGLLLGVVALARVPRRTRLVECALVLALLPALAPPLVWLCVGGLIAACGLVAWAPEHKALPLSGLDRLFIASDYAGLMDYHLWFETAEPVDVAAARSAVAELLREIPLARSFVRTSVWGAERFAATMDGFDAGDVLRDWARPLDLTAAQLFNARWDLANTPPFRIDLFTEVDGGSKVMFSFHHSFVDGTGAMYMMDLFAERYDLARGIAPAGALPLPPPVRRLRDLFADRSRQWKREVVRRSLGNRMARGTRFAALHDRGGSELGRAKVISTQVDELAYARYQRRARQLGCSTNTLIVGCALAAAAEWRAHRELSDAPMRALVATDIREQLGMGRSLQNWVSQIAVVVPEAHTEVTEMIDVLNDGLARARAGEALEQALRLAVNAAVYPTALARRLFARREADPATHTLTLGATTLRWNDTGPLATSSLGVEALELLGPVSRVPGVSLFIAGTRERLRINLGYRDGVLSDDGAAELLDLMTALLDRLTRETSARGHTDTTRLS